MSNILQYMNMRVMPAISIEQVKSVLQKSKFILAMLNEIKISLTPGTSYLLSHTASKANTLNRIFHRSTQLMTS